MDKNENIWRIIFAVFQFVVVIISAAILVGGVILYTSEALSMLLPQDALMALVSGSALAGISSLIAFLVIGIKKDADKARLRWIVVDSIMMATLAAGFILAALLTLQQASDLTLALKKNFSATWETSPPSLLTSIQKQGQCCGFNGYDDRVLEPCKRYAQAVGCWEVLRNGYSYYLRMILPVFFTMAVLCSVAAILALALIFSRILAAKRKKDSPFKDNEIFRTNRSQPFDTWHKAVFA